MSRINWNKCKKPGASYGGQRQLALKLKRKDETPATEKQIQFMKSLGIQYPEKVTKRQAMGMISKTLEKKRELDARANSEMRLAMDRDGR